MPKWGKNMLVSLPDLLRPESYEPTEIEYQRKLIPTRVEAIANDFDERAFGRITVVKRADGTLTVVDGYHRVEAALRRRYKQVPAVVYEGLTPAEEAHLFVRLNKDRSRVSQTAQFHAECVAGDDDALSLDRLLLTHDLDARDLGRRQKFAAIAPVKAALRFGGLDLVDKSFRAMRLAFVAPSRAAWWGNTRVVQGVTEFFATTKLTPAPTIEEFIEIIHAEFVTPRALWEAAFERTKKMGGGTGETGRRQNDAVVLLLLDRLRKLRRAKQKNGA